MASVAFAVVAGRGKCIPGTEAAENLEVESMATYSDKGCIRSVESKLEHLAIAVGVEGPWVVLLVLVPSLPLEGARKEVDCRIAILALQIAFRSPPQVEVDHGDGIRTTAII